MTVSATTGTISGFTTLLIDNTSLTVNTTSTIPSNLNVTFNRTNSFATNFNPGGQTYGTVKRTGSGNGQWSINAAGTYGTFQDNEGSAAHTITFLSGATQTVSTFTVAGATGQLITLRAGTTNSVWTLTTASGAKTADYVVIQDSTVDPSPTWTADSNSADGGNNTNWLGFAGGAGAGGGGSAVQVRGGSRAGSAGRRFP